MELSETGNEQKSILEGGRIGSAPADVAVPIMGKYQRAPSPPYRRRVAIQVGVEATQ
jgi:hypothetical protein